MSRLTRRADQTEAIEAVSRAFQSRQKRVQLIAPPGSGKTLMGLWVMEALGSREILVLAPSLSIIAQTVVAWTENQTGPAHIKALSVCSDETVADDIARNDVPIPVTTSVSEVAAFLTNVANGPRVIFATYQSAHTVARALQLAGFKARTKELDLVICDEAHRIAGRTDKHFQLVLDDREIPASRRLFMTATPRVLSTRRSDREDERVVSMDDHNHFGHVAYRLSYGQGIELGILADYQIDVLVAYDSEVRRLLQAGHHELTALSQAVASADAMEKGLFRHAFSFHHTKAQATRFADALRDVLIRDGINDVWSSTIFGEATVAARRAELGGMLEMRAGIIANVRALAEGIDAPGLDAIVFVDPKSSVVEIAQIVGRALRRDPGRPDKRAHIVLPLVISRDQSAERQLTSSVWEPVWRLLAAMSAHDERLQEELALAVHQRAWTDAAGKPAEDSETEHLLARSLFLSLPSSIPFERFRKSVALRALEEIRDPWEYAYGRLKAYLAQHAISDVPSSFVDHDGYRLGAWVVAQRSAFHENRLSDQRAVRLESLAGWRWQRRDEEWFDGFRALKRFVKRHGNARVPRFYIDESGLWLEEWVDQQREQFYAGQLPNIRAEALANLPGWQWQRLRFATDRDWSDPEPLASELVRAVELAWSEMSPDAPPPAVLEWRPPRSNEFVWHGHQEVPPFVDWVVRDVVPDLLDSVELTWDAEMLREYDPLQQRFELRHAENRMLSTRHKLDEMIGDVAKQSRLISDFVGIRNPEGPVWKAVQKRPWDEVTKARVVEAMPAANSLLYDAEQVIQRVVLYTALTQATKHFRADRRIATMLHLLAEEEADAKRPGNRDYTLSRLASRFGGPDERLRRTGFPTKRGLDSFLWQLVDIHESSAANRLQRRLRERGLFSERNKHRISANGRPYRWFSSDRPLTHRSGLRRTLDRWRVKEMDDALAALSLRQPGLPNAPAAGPHVSWSRAREIRVEIHQGSRNTRSLCVILPSRMWLSVRRAAELARCTERPRREAEAALEKERKALSRRTAAGRPRQRIRDARQLVAATPLDNVYLLIVSPLIAAEDDGLALRCGCWIEARALNSPAFANPEFRLGAVITKENRIVALWPDFSISPEFRKPLVRCNADGDESPMLQAAVRWLPDLRQWDGQSVFDAFANNKESQSSLTEVTAEARLVIEPSALQPVTRRSGSPARSLMPDGTIVENREQRFNENVRALKEFVGRSGHLFPAKADKPRGINIYMFLQRMEREWHAGTLSDDRRKVLENVPEWLNRVNRTTRGSMQTPEQEAVSRDVTA